MSKRSASFLFNNILDLQLSPIRKTRKIYLSADTHAPFTSTDDSINASGAPTKVLDDGINSMDMKIGQVEHEEFEFPGAAEVSLPPIGIDNIQSSAEHFMSQVHKGEIEQQVNDIAQYDNSVVKEVVSDDAVQKLEIVENGANAENQHASPVASESGESDVNEDHSVEKMAEIEQKVDDIAQDDEIEENEEQISIKEVDINEELNDGSSSSDEADLDEKDDEVEEKEEKEVLDKEDDVNNLNEEDDAADSSDEEDSEKVESDSESWDKEYVAGSDAGLDNQIALSQPQANHAPPSPVQQENIVLNAKEAKRQRRMEKFLKETECNLDGDAYESWSHNYNRRSRSSWNF